ncbi:MAG: hypothetical protein GDA39_04520 [Hyphomonadaceae bacterium]|nr:hypothetical protein [Hyphomonadaceae bacterium]MBC6412193.1 hypothetical protein [Hyphomonadaceae bacterium]
MGDIPMSSKKGLPGLNRFSLCLTAGQASDLVGAKILYSVGFLNKSAISSRPERMSMRGKKAMGPRCIMQRRMAMLKR